MKLLVHRYDGPPFEIEGDRVRIMCGKDHYEMREQVGHGPDGTYLLVRIEEHDGGLALDLAVFPYGGNAIRLKGGLR